MTGRRTGKKSSQYVTRKAVKDMISAKLEMKRIVGVTNATVSTAGVLIYKSSMAQGDDFDSRAGDKVYVHDMDYTFSFSDTVTSVARILIFKDTSNTGASPSVTEVLSSATVQAHLNPVYDIQGRYKVYVDRIVDVSVAGRQYVTVRGNLKIRSPVFFNGTGSTSTSGGKNALYALVIGGQATGAYALNTSMRFTDA